MIMVLERAILQHIQAREQIVIADHEIADAQLKLDKANEALVITEEEIKKYALVGENFYHLADRESVLKVTNLLEDRGPAVFKIEFHETEELSE